MTQLSTVESSICQRQMTQFVGLPSPFLISLFYHLFSAFLETIPDGERGDLKKKKKERNRGT